ncbi:hypothetical protein L2E82_50815 [Cichorium intybus]|nr:hypothetical protein L2E82_50815 [Cichorium intybus]
MGERVRSSSERSKESEDLTLIDDLTLRILQIEYACGRFPNNLELMMGLFDCYLRQYSFVKQQQIVIKMYKIAGEERFLLWAVCSIQLQVFCGNVGEKLLQLAEGLLKKHIASHSLHEPEALSVYISLLQHQAKYGDATQVLSGNLGSLIMIEVDKLRIQCFLHYLGCLLEDDCSLPMVANSPSIQFHSRISRASEFVEKLKLEAVFLQILPDDRKKQLLEKLAKSVDSSSTSSKNASKHPFVTGEPFTCPYTPAPETPRVPVSHNMKVDHHPAGGHWFATGLSPNVLGGNRVAMYNKSHFQVMPYAHGGNFGSLGSRGSYNDGTELGSSYGDNSNMVAYFSPVGPSAMNNYAQGHAPVLGSSPDARRRLMQIPHGNGFGFSPAQGNFAPMSLGTSPSQFTPPYSQVIVIVGETGSRKIPPNISMRLDTQNME